MKLQYRGWRRAAATVAAVVLAASPLAACSSAQDNAPQATQADSVTIAHKFGETKVPANASRVVTVGWTDQDFVLPLGVVPVSVRSFAENYDELPWVKTATDGKPLPTWGSDTIDFEAIAARKPDLIFAIYETIDKQTYDRLSQVAPTVIQSADYADEETPWNVQLLTTGKALGKEAEAKELVDEVQAKIDTDLTLVRTFLKGQGYPDDVITIGRLEVTDTKAREYVSAEGTPHYILAQSVIVRTHDVMRVSQTERALNNLVREGVVLDFTAPTYVFTKLNEVRPAMIAEATASARTGAEQFAKDSGAPLGPIAQATQGSFEILAREDVDTESTSLDKRVRVVATVSYRLK